MDAKTKSDLEAERTDLSRKLKVRAKLSGYSANVRAIQARLAVIEAQLNG